MVLKREASSLAVNDEVPARLAGRFADLVKGSSDSVSVLQVGGLLSKLSELSQRREIGAASPACLSQGKRDLLLHFVF